MRLGHPFRVLMMLVVVCCDAVGALLMPWVLAVLVMLWVLAVLVMPWVLAVLVPAVTER